MKVEKPIKGITAYPRIDIQLFQGYSLEVTGCSAFTRDRSHPSYAIDKKSLIGDVSGFCRLGGQQPLRAPTPIIVYSTTSFL